MNLSETLATSRFCTALNSCNSLLKSWAARTGRQKSQRRVRLLTDQCDLLEPRQLLTVALNSATFDEGILKLDIENGDGKYFAADVNANSIVEHRGLLTDDQLSFSMDPAATQIYLRFFDDQQETTEIAVIHVSIPAPAELGPITTSAGGGGVSGSIIMPATTTNAVWLLYRTPGATEWQTLWDAGPVTGTTVFSVMIPGLQTDTAYEFCLRTDNGITSAESAPTTIVVEAPDADPDADPDDDPFI